MSIINTLYNVLGIPFGYVIRAIYSVIPNYTISLILFTLFARLLMVPSTISQQKGQVKTQRIQPKIRRINEKYKGDQKKIQEETQALYQREGYNPMSAGCAPLLIQLPIIYGLIGVIYHPLKFVLRIPSDVLTNLTAIAEKAVSNKNFSELYVIQHIGEADYAAAAGKYLEKIQNFPFDIFGVSLGEVPKGSAEKLVWIVPVLSFLASLLSGVYSLIRSKRQNPEAANNPTMGCMTLGMPLLSLVFTFSFPIGIGIYWIASSLFAFITTLIVNQTHSPSKLIAKDMVDETVIRRSKENSVKKRIELKNQSEQ